MKRINHPPKFGVRAPTTADLRDRSMDARRLLLSVLGEETDDEVVDYVIGSIDDTDGASIDELVELLAAHSVTEASEESLRTVAIQVSALVTSQPAVVVAAPLERAPPPDASKQAAPSRVVRAAAARQPQLPQQPRPQPQSPDDDGGCRPSHAAPNEAAVAALRELVPDASPGVCRLVLLRSGGSLDEAAEILFSSDLAELEAAAADKEARGAAEEEHERKSGHAARRRLVNRYSQVAESEGPLKLEPPRLPYGGSRKDALRGQSTRYRDGQVSSVKGGSKFIVEEKEEWDGGSKGKVNNKGKRGPGFA